MDVNAEGVPKFSSIVLTLTYAFLIAWLDANEKKLARADGSLMGSAALLQSQTSRGTQGVEVLTEEGESEQLEVEKTPNTTKIPPSRTIPMSRLYHVLFRELQHHPALGNKIGGSDHPTPRPHEEPL
ncbi:MAG: hypothetical protein EBX52_04130 [Proteobacteria bacterium]|nr:hypothetical protein [Pseudomonadota bacterium]